MEETLTLRDKLDAIEACDRLIAYYKEQLQDANKRPINMGDDIYELEMTDDEKDRLDDMEYCRKKIVATMETKKRLGRTGSRPLAGSEVVRRTEDVFLRLRR